jgi:hypothetical protein
LLLKSLDQLRAAIAPIFGTVVNVRDFRLSILSSSWLIEDVGSYSILRDVSRCIESSSSPLKILRVQRRHADMSECEPTRRSIYLLQSLWRLFFLPSDQTVKP